MGTPFGRFWHWHRNATLLCESTVGRGLPTSSDPERLFPMPLPFVEVAVRAAVKMSSRHVWLYEML